MRHLRYFSGARPCQRSRDVLVQSGRGHTRKGQSDQQVSPRLDLRILDVDAAFDTSTRSLDTYLGEQINGGWGGREFEHTEVRPVLMVPEYADPESIPFLKSIPRSILSRFRAICHRYGTFTESKIVNLYRTSGITTMLYGW